MYLRRPEVPLNEALLPTPQADRGAIDRFNTGLVVTDTNGGVVPGAAVRLTDDSGRSFETITDANGNFSLGGLGGRIRASVSLPGFRSQEAIFDAASGVKIPLSVGSVSETVSVTAAPKSRGLAGGSAGGAYRPAPPPAPPPAFRVGGNASEVALMLAQTTAAATTRDLGDLFEYKLKGLVTIPRNQSAMVPIISGPDRRQACLRVGAV